ncbi:MAG: TlpA family protein disulfide reductase [Gammaproteobacteria bacterium]|nr:TlpA family protein disulfide reductase [Gammaproteobacteria bacterium]MBL7000124.1 TlpA family protein disulfide reductase [Gammaproteobacteria bacterium]
MNRQYLLFTLIGLLSAVGGGLFYQSFNSSPEIYSVEKMDLDRVNSLPSIHFDDIALNDLTGQSRHLQEWDSPLLMVNFWAPWCAPCRREIPALKELQTSFSDQLQIIGLSFDSQQRVSAFNQQHNINYPLLLVQHEASMVNRYFGNGSGALPFTALLNPQRQIIYKHHGEITREELEKQIKTALEVH